MSNFNGFENRMLTLQLAGDSTVQVRASSTGPGSIFFGSDHYKGGSPLVAIFCHIYFVVVNNNTVTVIYHDNEVATLQQGIV